MKKIVLILLIIMGTMIFSLGPVQASGEPWEMSEVGEHYYQYQNTIGTDNVFVVRFYLDDVLLSLDMSGWYTAFDNIYAVDHVYFFDRPIIFTDDGIVQTDGISIMYVDYNSEGASASTLYFYDSDEVLIGATAMDDLTNLMLLSFLEDNEYTITFETNGGNAISPQILNYGDYVVEPTDPTKGDHTFTGWYKDINLTQAFDFSSETVTGNLTLYAGWNTLIYTVTFNVNGGSVVETQEVTEGEYATQPATPTRTGYTFSGWYINQIMTIAFVFTEVQINDNITLYAKWVPISSGTPITPAAGPISPILIYGGLALVIGAILILNSKRKKKRR